MPNKHYSVEYVSIQQGCSGTSKFFSLVKAKQFYKSIKLYNYEVKFLRQDNCVLMSDAYWDYEWIHKEKGV